MNSTMNLTRRQTTDPRYKNGVYTNTAGQRRQEAAHRMNWQLDNNPLHWGWKFVEWVDDYTPMYRQGDIQLVRVGRRWHVAKWGDEMGVFYGGSIKRLTGYLWALGLSVGRDTWPVPAVVKLTEAETERLQAEWEAQHPVDDYGLAGWY